VILRAGSATGAGAPAPCRVVHQSEYLKVAQWRFARIGPRKATLSWWPARVALSTSHRISTSGVAER
jgi:hypothetical protein